MKKYLFCLLILAVLLGISCSSAPATPEPPPPPVTQEPTTTPASTPPATTQPPVSTPPPAPPPVTTTPTPPANVMLSPFGLDMSDAVEYTVVYGDFLSEITRTFYGHLTDVGPAGTRNGFYYPMLLLASEDEIDDPDWIFPGMRLKIPDLKKNLANPNSRRAIKEILLETAILYGNKRLPEEEEGLRRLADSL